MSRLILVRHAAPQVDRSAPARTWPLSAEGVDAAARLADRLAAFTPAVVAASPEPKARQTAAPIAARAGLPLRIVDDLCEHQRETVPYFVTRAAFETLVAAFFAMPDRLVFGDETAAGALARFDAAVLGLLHPMPAGDAVLVTHGTVIALFAAHHLRVDPFPFWEQLTTPWYGVFSLPDLRLLEIGDFR